VTLRARTTQRRLTNIILRGNISAHQGSRDPPRSQRGFTSRDPLQYSPQTSRPEVERSQRSSFSGARRWRAGRGGGGGCTAGVETTAGRAKPPGGWPGGNGSLVVSAEMSGAKCTLRLVRAPGGGKSRKRTPGGRPRGRGNAGGAEGSLQAFRRRVETLSVLVPICRVKWCRDRLRTV